MLDAAGLKAAGISVTRQSRTLLDIISVAFEPGTVNVIIGPNGAGKSTLLSCLAGLCEPGVGSVTLDGHSIAAMDSKFRGRNIGLLPQNGEVNWNIIARDLVELGRFPYLGVASAEADNAAINAAMQAADCAQFAERHLMQLSGGERARVLLARVLAGQPKWLLADEPLANLDPRYQMELLSHLRRLADDGMGVVVVLHDLTLAARVADHVVLLNNGKIFASGAPLDVICAANLEQVYGIKCEMLTDGSGSIAIVSFPA
jgi:iron complex transport system ATP-binding protein